MDRWVGRLGPNKHFRTVVGGTPGSEVRLEKTAGTETALKLFCKCKF